MVINDKSQRSVATYFRCGGIFSTCITTSLLLSLSLTKICKICEHLVKGQAGKTADCLTRGVHVVITMLKHEFAGYLEYGEKQPFLTTESLIIAWYRRLLNWCRLF